MGNGTTTGRGIKTLLVMGALAMTLMFGLMVAAVGTAVVGVAGFAVGAAAGGVVVAHGACTTVEGDLAGDLGLTVDELRVLTPTAINDRIAARLASKALTTEQADRDRERAGRLRLLPRGLRRRQRERLAPDQRSVSDSRYNSHQGRAVAPAPGRRLPPRSATAPGPVSYTDRQP